MLKLNAVRETFSTVYRDAVENNLKELSTILDSAELPSKASEGLATPKMLKILASNNKKPCVLLS